jgi:prepilin-type N-terminal cleavage/methylation domain-containing protein
MLNSQKGVGLIEIVIAMLIFALGVTAAMRTLPESNRATMRAQNMTEATNLAQERIETLMGSPFSDPDLTAGDHVDPQNPVERIYTRTWTVADNTPISGMKRLAVTVSYTAHGNDNSVTLNTYLTSRR